MFGFDLPLWLIGIGRFIKGLPNEVWYVLAALLAWWVFSSHYESKGYNKRTAEYAAVIAEAEKKAATGAIEAKEASQATVDAIKAENSRAVEAASECDDILKCGMDAF